VFEKKVSQFGPKGTSIVASGQVQSGRILFPAQVRQIVGVDGSQVAQIDSQIYSQIPNLLFY
jgi:hypothetical protein